MSPWAYSDSCRYCRASSCREQPHTHASGMCIYCVDIYNVYMYCVYMYMVERSV